MIIVGTTLFFSYLNFLFVIFLNVFVRQTELKIPDWISKKIFFFSYIHAYVDEYLLPLTCKVCTCNSSFLFSDINKTP